MTSAASRIAALSDRLAATAALPCDEQVDALVEMLRLTAPDELAPLTALLIGEVVTLRACLASLAPPRRPVPLPS